ncbi:hypothetical protein [Streptomyces sp. T028]|uniref:hypothetical protein n=1 Tax=Streptomyces sp. T028 TaxID=3394379 RepID=UPI003A89286A
MAVHIRVLTGARAQIPGSSAAKILVRADDAGATHGLLERLEALNATRRTVRYTVGWKITDADEQSIAKLRLVVAELTGLDTREDWPQGMRLIVRRVRPSRRHPKKLTAFEARTGRRYRVNASKIRHVRGIAGSGHSQSLDGLHRSHAGVEDRVRTDKAMGLDDLPSGSWQVNRGWMLAVNLAADGCGSKPPGPGPKPPAGNDSPPSRPSPDRPGTGPTRTRKEKTGSTRGPRNPAHPRRHATALPQTAEDTDEPPTR